jgi:hypothetical protein
MVIQVEDRDQIEPPATSVKYQPGHLPIFSVTAQPVDRQVLADLACNLFGVEDFKFHQCGHRLSLQAGSKLVEMDGRSGGIWAADEAELWNPEQEPSLPNTEQAQKLAGSIIERAALLPSLDPQQPFRMAFSNVGGSFAAIEDLETGQRRERQLDVQVNHTVRALLPIGAKGESGDLEMVGGGGQFSLTLGDKGRVIGFNGVWRQVEKSFMQAPIIPREQADARFREQVGRLNLQEYEANLAYYCAPSSATQKYMYPVYVYRGIALVGRERVSLRIITVPATSFAPELPKLEPQAKRTTQLASVQLSKPSPAMLAAAPVRGAMRATNPFEAGTSWIGPSGGLSGSPANAQGFINELADDGWTIDFNWGDANAWESDWRANDDQWVDDADFVFYTGHANMNGWVLSAPNDTFLHSSEVGGAADRWGKQDLEWLIVAACGPLQDELIGKGGGNVFNRWRDAFDGLHILMGYGGITFDNTTEGRTIIEYAKDGQRLIDAWFRTAKEIQPSTNGAAAPDGPNIYVGAMYAYRSGTTSPRNDHLWGHGSVAADSPNPNVRVCMWTTT